MDPHQRYGWNNCILRLEIGDASTASGSTVSHMFTTAGAYAVKLTVKDDQAVIATSTKTITVNVPANQPPVASDLTIFYGIQ